jgi:iron complex transport system ATP-binding protein
MTPVTTEVPVLVLDRVSFARRGTTILSDIDLTVRSGEHWALLGPNGAGKSTVLSFCGAMAHPTSGTVDVLGGRLGRVELQSLRKDIGHVDPRHGLQSPLSIRDVVLTGLTGTLERVVRWEATVEDVARADELIDSVGLANSAHARWTSLSQGERGRTLIARALISEPRLLLLDEPSTGLDVAAREQLLETLDGLDRTHPGVASVLVTHHLEELPTTTDHAMLLSHGRVIATGAAGEVITTENVSAAFEHPIDVERRDGRWSARARPQTTRHAADTQPAAGAGPKPPLTNSLENT